MKFVHFFIYVIYTTRVKKKLSSHVLANIHKKYRCLPNNFNFSFFSHIFIVDPILKVFIEIFLLRLLGLNLSPIVVRKRKRQEFG